MNFHVSILWGGVATQSPWELPPEMQTHQQRVWLDMCAPLHVHPCLRLQLLGCCIGHFLEPGAHKGNASWLMLGLCTCKLQGGDANKHWDLTSKQLHICTPWCFAIAKHWSQPQAMTDTARLGTCSALFVYPRDGGQDSSGPPAGVSTPISTTHS